MKTYLDPKDVKLMEQFTCSLRDELLVRLLFRLGCRISEALAIRFNDIDFERGTVTILHLKTRINLQCPKCKVRLGKRHQFCPECGNAISKTVEHQQEHKRIRTLPIDADTLTMLNDYLASGSNNSHDDSKLLFKLSRHRAWQIIRDCARKANLPKLVNPETGRIRGISPHRLRDAFSVHAMKLDDSGDALRLLQEHLGHASFNTTAKYRKVAGEEHRKWYESLWRKID